MMRGGLLQKQSTSSVCLLCRHRWQLRQQQQQRIHPNTRRVYSSWDDKPSWGIQQQPATPSAGGGGGGGGGWGGSWKPAAPATPATQTTPETGTAQGQPKSANAGLLPHEIAARQRLLRMAEAAVAAQSTPQPARNPAPEPPKRASSDRPVRRLPEGQQNEFNRAPPRKEQQGSVVRRMLLHPKQPNQDPTTETPGPKTEREAQRNQAPVRKVLEPFGIRRFPARAPQTQQPAPKESPSSQTASSNPTPSRPTQSPASPSQPTVSSLSSLSNGASLKPGPASKLSEQTDGASGKSSWDALEAASSASSQPIKPASGEWGTSSWGASSWGASSASSQPASQSQTERLLPHEKVARDRLQQRHAQSYPQAPAKNLKSLADGLFAHDRQTGQLSAKDLRKRQEAGSLRNDLLNAEEEERRADNTDAWDDIFSTQPPPPPPPPPSARRTSAREVYQSISSKFAPPPAPPSDSKSSRETEGQWAGLIRRTAGANVGNGRLTGNNDFVKTAPPSETQKRSEPRDSRNFWKQAEDRYATSPAPQAQPEAASESTREATEAFKKQMSDGWDWADDYEGKSKEKEGQKLEQQDFEKPRGRDNARQTRGDRVALEEIPIPSRYIKEEKKPKKKGGRRRDYNEDDDFDDMAYEYKRRERLAKKAEKERLQFEETGPIPILLPEFISVANLGMALGVKTDLFISQLGELGFEDIAKDSIMTGETAALVAQEYGFEPTVDAGEDEDLRPRPPPEDPSSVPLRPPVVTIMGHVDHGKTTLLDFLRKSSIAAGEHGGITQHIGAFSVQMSSGKQITFLDTPGHAAFLSMRQRGANVTDIVILVVAADDSVKPQTIEAIKHARSAKVPMIVAINKIDKDQANVERVKSDLAANGVEIEDYGGDVQVVCVSGKTGQGMDDLEDNILLLSEMLDIRAEPDGMAEGWVLESSIKPIGRVATVLVKRGTLRPGDFIVAGRVFAKVRSLRNEAGIEVEEAPPGTAVEILGWKEPPEAGDMVLQAPNEDKAKSAVHYRIEQKEREEAMEQITEMERLKREREAERIAAEEAEKGEDGAEAAEEKPDGPKMINFTVKGDVHGSVEAVCASILEIGSNEVRPRVLLSSPGQITESDVEHAAVSGSTIINFNNPIPGHIKRMAVENKVRIMDHNIIYNLTEEVRQVLSESLAPTISFKVLGEAEVAQVFAINIKGRKYKNIAGVKVRNGMVMRNGRVRLQRKGEVVFDGTISSVKHGKKEVTEMRKGTECGLEFGEFDDIKEGDLIQVVEEIRERRYL
ncbi:uncharacterized protein B0T23DRAFT_57950 [Neurospora hispaniola]|uniref:Translation initiation factor IF-2, mitochondrial n=1 Tax=Neurospora hispaniola TaxID=588809 RepID=A0AAJ0MLH8_9PEZI|nr:hypothetical protein B0T23DRAFT_57950 [Neurospora hispaniola]